MTGLKRLFVFAAAALGLLAGGTAQAGIPAGGGVGNGFAENILETLQKIHQLVASMDEPDQISTQGIPAIDCTETQNADVKALCEQSEATHSTKGERQ